GQKAPPGRAPWGDAPAGGASVGPRPAARCAASLAPSPRATPAAARGDLPPSLFRPGVPRDRPDHRGSHLYRRQPLSPRDPPVEEAHGTAPMKRAPFPFQGPRPPSPPEGLKQCVLLAARGAAPAGDPSLVDRIWESGWVRLSAAVLFATLLAL